MTAMRTSRALILALGLCWIATSAAVAQQQIALVDIGDNGVIWSPLTADKAVLTVSGPSGDFRYELEAGEKAAFEIFDKAGGLLQDGTYSWQMTTLPTVSAETRRRHAEGSRRGHSVHRHPARKLHPKRRSHGQGRLLRAAGPGSGQQAC